MLGKSIIPVALIGIAWAANAGAQDRTAVFHEYLEFASLVEGASLEPNWLSDGASFWHVEGGPADRAIWKIAPAANSKTPFFDAARLRSALTEALGYEPPGKGIPFEGFALTPTGGAALFRLEGSQFSLDLDSYSVARLPAPDPGSALAQSWTMPKTFARRGYFGMTMDVADTLSPDGKWFARLQGDNVALRSTKDGRERRLTEDGTADHAWDIESDRILLGAGLTMKMVPFHSWAPDSLKLWATKIDRSRLARKYEIRYMQTEDQIIERPVTIAGGQLSRVSPHILNVLSREAMPIEIGEIDDFYFCLLGWRPDSSEVLFARFSRDFKRMDLMAANARTGAARTLFSETADSFVKIQHDIISFGNAGFRALPDGSGFLWESTRDGWNHLYLYGYDGKLKRQLTKGSFPVLEAEAVDSENGWVYFRAHGDPNRVYDTHLYRTSLKGGPMQRLTEGEGQHQAQFSPSLEYFIDTYSAPGAPPKIDLRAADGTLVRNLGQADIGALEALGWTPSEEFVVKAADGATDLWGVMHRPYDFDPGKRYPVLEYLYAGPQIVTADRSFSTHPDKMRNLPRALAQLGYIVITLDARGTPERSKAFQDVVYRNWGRNEIPDHAGAIAQLGERHDFMDLSRVGVWGHSWGGYFALRALSQAPDTYHAALSSAPGFDPYAGLLYEPYLGLPDEAKEAYEYASAFRLATQIRGKLMLVGGTADYFTFPDFMKMSRTLIDAGILHEQVVLPEEGHGYIGKGQEYFINALVDFFGRHLAP